MSVVRRARDVTRRGLRVQRRIALGQAVFLPAVLAGGLALGAATLAVKRSRRKVESAAV